MVLHFREHHGGHQQDVLFRVVKHTRTALERQVWESVMIDAPTDPSLCLNLKAEWGGSKDPELTAKES